MTDTTRLTCNKIGYGCASRIFTRDVAESAY